MAKGRQEAWSEHRGKSKLSLIRDLPRAVPQGADDQTRRSISTQPREAGDRAPPPLRAWLAQLPLETLEFHPARSAVVLRRRSPEA
ncbi:MAG: hypothetical protein P8M11_17315 [Planctomycetota bacterium]|nr:hypothetical protein [Planctomycetota bacterium]MDG1986316.1 hypothetical protein [Planctomycetota bacterium]